MVWVEAVPAAAPVSAGEGSAGPLLGSNAAGWEALLASPVRKEYRAGTERICSPRETVDRVRVHLAAMGITRIANVTGLDRIGVPVVMVCRPNSRSLATSQGKGLDLDAAIASGVMECIELHHAEHVLRPLVLASTAELQKTHRLVDLAGLPRIRNSRYHRDLQLLWIEGFDLASKEAVWLPFETVHASAATPAPTGSGCFAATSNGLASGNHLLEAIVHGLLEVIERDATAVWGAGGPERRKQSVVDLSTIDDPACVMVLERCAAAGAQVTVFETTSDVGIPSFLCELSDEYTDAPGQLVFSGLGCHLNRGIALLRALTEAIQSRLTLIAGSRDDLSHRDYQSYEPSSPALEPVRSFGDAPLLHPATTFNEDLAFICERLQAIGLDQIVVVDLSHPELRIPVVRVVVPGLEGPDDDPEYVPGPRARAVREHGP